MNEVNKSKVIFEEDRPVYNSSEQKRYWLIIIVLLILHLLYLLIPVVQGMRYGSEHKLLVQNFNYFLRSGETVIAFTALILFFRKATWGWLLATAGIALRTTEFLAIVLFFLYRGGFNRFGLEVVVLFFAYAVLLYLVYKPLVRSMFKVERSVARVTLFIGAIIGLAIFIFQIVEPYWRLRRH